MPAKGFFVVFFFFCMNQMLLYTSSTHTSIQLRVMSSCIVGQIIWQQLEEQRKMSALLNRLLPLPDRLSEWLLLPSAKVSILHVLEWSSFSFYRF